MALVWKATNQPVRVGDVATGPDGTPVTVTSLVLDKIGVGDVWYWPYQLGAHVAWPDGSLLRQATPVKAATSVPTTAKRANPAIICPHCQTKGQVTTHAKKLKQGLSSGKVVAALFTGGLTMITPGIGLSRKQQFTQAKCSNCGSEWLF